MIEKGVDKAVRTSISNDLAANTPPITQETSLARNATPILGASTSAVIPQVPENHHEHAAIRCNGVLKQLLLIKTASEPLAYGIATKWLITLVVAGAAAVDPISSTILYRTYILLSSVMHILIADHSGTSTTCQGSEYLSHSRQSGCLSFEDFYGSVSAMVVLLIRA